MKQTIVQFGASPQLFGIHTEGTGAARRAAVVLVNSGIVHRVGANRNTVALARRLAGEGYHSLRFDMSGIGDAPDRRDAVSWDCAAAAEIRDAVDALCAASRTDEVVLYGNCGGAAKSFWAARLEPRVRGLMFTNPPPPPADAEFGADVEAFAHGRLLPAGAESDPAPGLAALLDRGVRALLVYAQGDVGESYFHRRLAPRLGPYLSDHRLTVERVTSSNHTFVTGAARATFLDAAMRWLTCAFPA